ncbi:hypothetical protein [Methylotuvimicrobium sp. KM2]|uniref:hypothetical protein n=1 Tax=Methylotuvimicrobium sp. KM2 TaxID=3133976 RepID=UPI0031018633
MNNVNRINRERCGSCLTAFYALCQIDDIEALAEAAGEMRDNQKLWRNMKEASRNNAELFSENAAVNRYIEIYKTLSLPA